MSMLLAQTSLDLLISSFDRSIIIMLSETWNDTLIIYTKWWDQRNSGNKFIQNFLCESKSDRID